MSPRVTLCAEAALPAEGELRRATPAGMPAIAYGRTEGAFFAVADTCPHATASLAEGFLEGRLLVCPVHFAEFDVATGAVSNPPSADCPRLRVFATVLEEGELRLLTEAEALP
jgi:nitrite reductase/ring-hydroxylating ferredoxin subunit